MSEKHDHLVANYKSKLLNMGYSITKKSPFVDYRPDVCAVKKNKKLFAEVELDKSLHNDHTLGQLNSMHKYVRKSKSFSGALVVPKFVVNEARLLIESVFGDNKIKVVGL